MVCLWHVNHCLNLIMPQRVLAVLFLLAPLFQSLTAGFRQCSVSTTAQLITFNTTVKVEAALLIPCQHSDILKEGFKIKEANFAYDCKPCLATNTPFFLKVAEPGWAPVVSGHGHILNSSESGVSMLAPLWSTLGLWQTAQQLCLVPTCKFIPITWS